MLRIDGQVSDLFACQARQIQHDAALCDPCDRLAYQQHRHNHQSEHYNDPCVCSTQIQWAPIGGGNGAECQICGLTSAADLRGKRTCAVDQPAPDLDPICQNRLFLSGSSAQSSLQQLRLALAEEPQFPLACRHHICNERGYLVQHRPSMVLQTAGQSTQQRISPS